MSLTGFAAGQVRQVASAWVKRRVLTQPATLTLARSDWAKSLTQPTEFYFECYRHFHQKLAPELRAHREYFRQPRGNPRGFGEDAFHVMWHALFQEFKPASYLEIGVYRGQTISLAALLGRMQGKPCEVCAISPFSSAGDAVSKYGAGVDYYADTLANFEHFKLPQPKLHRGYSTDADAVAFIRSRAWDVIYIDGNHDYEVALADWRVCSESVRPGGIVVLDDSGLTTSYRPPPFATGGHPGPSRVAQEIDRARFEEILQVGHNRVFQRRA